MSPSKTLMVRPSKAQVQQGGREGGKGGELHLPLLRGRLHRSTDLPPRWDFSQLSKKPGERHRLVRRNRLNGSGSIHGLGGPTVAGGGFPTRLNFSRQGATLYP